MPDSDRKFEEIAASVYRMADKPSGEERRRHKRTPVNGQIVAHIQRNDAPPISALVRDLSRSGMGLSCTDPVRRGQGFVVTVNLGAGLLRFNCKSANCRLGDDKRYIIGAEFVAIERSGSVVATAPGDFTSASNDGPLDKVSERHVADVAKRLEKALHEIDRKP